MDQETAAVIVLIIIVQIGYFLALAEFYAHFKNIYEILEVKILRDRKKKNANKDE